MSKSKRGYDTTVGQGLNEKSDSIARNLVYYIDPHGTRYSSFPMSESSKKGLIEKSRDVINWLDGELARRSGDSSRKSGTNNIKGEQKVSHTSSYTQKVVNNEKRSAPIKRRKVTFDEGDIVSEMKRVLELQGQLATKAAAVGYYKSEDASKDMGYVSRELEALEAMQSLKSEAVVYQKHCFAKSIVEERRQNGGKNLPIKKRRFVDLTQEEPNLVSDAYQGR